MARVSCLISAVALSWGHGQRRTSTGKTSAFLAQPCPLRRAGGPQTPASHEPQSAPGGPGSWCRPCAPAVSGDLALGLLDLWPPERAEAGPASPGLPSPKAPAPPRALSEQGLRNSGLQGQQEHGCRRGKVREASLRSALRMDRPLNPQTQRHRLQTNDKRATSGCKCVEVLQGTFYLFPIYNVLMKGHSTHLELEKLRLKEP